MYLHPILIKSTMIKHEALHDIENASIIHVMRRKFQQLQLFLCD